MTSYIENVKKNVAGQGIVYQVGYSQSPEEEHVYENVPPLLPSSPPPPLPNTSPPPSSLPPPPPELLDIDSLHISPSPGYGTNGTFLAKPFNVGSSFLQGPRPYNGRVGSAGSSLTSSPSPPPTVSPPGVSPTPTVNGGRTGLTRPSQFVTGHGGQNYSGQQNNYSGQQNRHGNSSHNSPAGSSNSYTNDQEKNRKLPIIGDPVSSNQTNPSHPVSSNQSNSGSTWRCRGCDQVMSPGEVAIFAERAGDDNCWHPSCFNCSR